MKRDFLVMSNTGKKVWKILISKFFSKWINSDDHILDLGCGYGEFINQVDVAVRHGMDLNPKTKEMLDDKINFHKQDCSKPWDIEPNSLDLVFTSNFFEHLPSKASLDRTMNEIKKGIKTKGKNNSNGPKYFCSERKILGFLGPSCCPFRCILVRTFLKFINLQCRKK